MKDVLKGLNYLWQRRGRFISLGALLLAVGHVADIWTLVTQVIPGVTGFVAGLQLDIHLPAADQLWPILSTTLSVFGVLLLATLVVAWLLARRPDRQRDTASEPTPRLFCASIPPAV